MISSYYSKWLMVTVGALAIAILLAVVLLTGHLIIKPQFPYLIPGPGGNLSTATQDFPVAKFKSEQDFKDYLAKTASLRGGYGFGGGMMPRAMSQNLGVPVSGDLVNLEGNINLGAKTSESLTPERVSETNVQVMGIDEPDIVKTDGQQIYFSGMARYYALPEMRMMPSEKIMPPAYQANIKTIKAFPQTELALLSTIDINGDLLLVRNNLLVFTYDKIVGYDVADPKNPTKVWEMKYQENNQLVSARLYNNQVYLITRASVKYGSPCPLRPFLLGERDIIIPCTDIYHPVTNVPVDVTYTAMIIDPTTGKEQQAVSFIGSSDLSLFYMSGDNLYITYSYPGDMLEFIYGAVKGAGDLFPSWFVSKLEALRTYDISQEAKMTEFQKLMEKLQNSLSSDERLKLENEFQHRMSNYTENHKRDLEQTGIVKIEADELLVISSSSVPGRPLNQFSLDEYQGNLRIATTIGSNWWGIGGIGSMTSVSDVYILDKKLKLLGAVKDLGETERIYSVRFVQNKGYLVTFRQIDPFYVLDLANPQKPVLAGELKIPGFSSYLHPLTSNLILGVGQENWQAKLSLFDVSNPQEPKELDKYPLEDSWTEVQNNHHAFLQDAKHSIVFVPGGRGGYVFSYSGDKLSMSAAVSDIAARRAVYINDYLYVIGDTKLVVLNENSWQKVNELDFAESNRIR